MVKFSTVTGLLSPNHPEGIVLIGTLITLTVVNPLLGLLAFIVTVVLAQARENYGVLEACNIPVVKPSLFRGSEPNLHKTVVHLADWERFKQYGGVWGSYVGLSPQVYIADPELIRLMFVKDFAHFADRQDVDLGTPLVDEILDFLPGEKWKTLRVCLSPLFTTAKLKQMSDVIGESAEEFMEDLKSECDAEGRLKFECRNRLSAWLIDMFARTTLGIRMEDAKNPNNKFAESFRNMLGEYEEFSLLYSLSLSFPFLSKLAPAFNAEPTKLIESTFRQVMESRRKNPQPNTKDFLDVLCELMGRVPTKEFKDLGITETTIIAQAVNFFVGGYDPSVTALAHLMYYMAEDPQIQDKMYDELKEALSRRRDKDDGGKAETVEIDHEIFNDIPYISACISESLRLYPAVQRPERICTKDWNHNGISIKKGTVVMLAAYAANRNPKVYPDQPEEFKPERFLPENKGNLDPYAFTTFGFGPRNCIGMRFAYENLKLFVCNFVKNFRVEKRADTTLKYKPGSLLLIAFRPLYFDLVKRK